MSDGNANSNDSIGSHSTPPAVCFRGTDSDQELWVGSGAIRFVVNGNQSPEIAIDEVSTYGYLVHQARSWLEIEYCDIKFFFLTFLWDDPEYHVFVSSRNQEPEQMTNNTVYRNFYKRIHEDCQDRMAEGRDAVPTEYIEVTVVAQSC